jgi:LytR cell envelope-related transcriptional attenuator
VTTPEPVSARRAVRYRRRRPLPAIVLIGVLGLVAAIVWLRTLETAERRTDTACTAPQTGVGDQQARGEVLNRNALDEVDPLPPDAVKVTVLNANGQRGQAGVVASVLSVDLGFAKADEPANDPLYPNFDLDCQAQIRFGPNGIAAGRTLSLVVPCAELMRDARPDDTVHLALGKQFEALRPSAEAKEILRQLTELAARPPHDPSGGQQGAQPTVDPALLAAARDPTRC